MKRLFSDHPEVLALAVIVAAFAAVGDAVHATGPIDSAAAPGVAGVQVRIAPPGECARELLEQHLDKWRSGHERKLRQLPLRLNERLGERLSERLRERLGQRRQRVYLISE